MSQVKNIVVLGCSGSIGQQTLDVVEKHPDKFKIIGLVAYSSVDKLNEGVQKFNVPYSVLVKNQKSAEEANKKIIDLITMPNVDIVVNAMSGACGLEYSYATLQAGKTLALANKESLVVGGDILMPIAKELRNANNGVPKLLPIDSEHGAIFQCLIGEESNDVYKLWITASGGPFYGKTIKDLDNVTKDDALAHPTWNMGPKITIDSATLMNKGLEVIEAHHLFGVDADTIQVVVQRQSAIHSMVEFVDGSVKAHLGTTDMRIPIQYALSYPERLDSPVKRLDFSKIQNLEFGQPDCKTFKCLSLAFEAIKLGGTMPCVMNAANEVAVAAFLQNKCKFLDIANIVEKVMTQAQKSNELYQNHVESLLQLQQIDSQSRNIAYSLTY